MKAYHVNTEEAVQIHHDLNAKLSLGMHWGTFPLTAEPPMEPFQRLNRIRAQGGIAKGTAFETLKVGETFTINK
jgi:N-acyl-phosphatidylethanolamine-hydrolysing phospholipase D